MRYIYILAFLIPLISYSEDKFQDLIVSPVASKKMSQITSYNSSMMVVQTRTVNRFWLSEISLGLSHIISGSPYSYSGSASAGYQLHFNPQFSLGFQYSYNLHKINQEGRDMLTKFHRIPFLLKYAQKQSYQFQGYWYPLYGKYVLGNKVFHSDIYTKVAYILQELHHLDKLKGASVGVGLVTWWNQRVNSRLEIEAQYYNYKVKDRNQNVIFTSFNFSVGLLL